MMKKRIERAKTQKKQSRKMLPQLKIPKRLMTIQNFFFIREQRKLSQTTVKKQSMRKQKHQARRYADQNYGLLLSGKQSLKISKKKINSQSMIIQQIIPNSFSPSKAPKKSNIVDFALDQYQGLRDYNQDRILISNINILGKLYNIFGVFDGHGGSTTSQYVKNNFTKIFQQQMHENPLLQILENLRKSIYKLQFKLFDLSKTKPFLGGTCASILVISQDMYHIAHLGDSRILEVKSSNNQGYHFSQLTTDHKPDEKNQKLRIQSIGGKIYRNKVTLKDNSEVFGPYRVFPGKLSVSRTIGDFQAKNLPYGNSISWQPELLSGVINQRTMFLMFSDGAYQKFENNQIVEYFTKQKCFEQVEIRKSIQSMLLNSILKQNNDNISIVSIIAQPMNRSTPTNS